MTTQTRIVSTMAAAALAVTAVFATASAQQPPPGRGPGGPGRPGPGGPAPFLRQLNLTDAQRDQIKALTDEQRAQTDQAPGRKVMELQRALQAAIYADAPDTAKIDELRTAIADAESAALATRVELELKIAQVLTPEQRKLARELSDRGPGRGGPRGGPGGARP